MIVGEENLRIVCSAKEGLRSVLVRGNRSYLFTDQVSIDGLAQFRGF